MTAPAPTSASFPQTTGTTGSPIGGYFTYLTPPHAQAFAALHIGGVDEGSRVQFLGYLTNQIPPLTPASSGSYTIRVYDSLTGGTLMAETGTITVSQPTAPAIAGGTTPILSLDASSASSVTSDSGYTTPQTTNGGVVRGWKDGSGNGYNFNNTTTTTITLSTNARNGRNGILFPASGQQLLNGPSALAALVSTYVNSGATSGATFLIISENPSYSGGAIFRNLDFESAGNTINFCSGTAEQVYYNGSNAGFTGASQSYQAMIVVVDPVAATVAIYSNVNGYSGALLGGGSYTPASAAFSASIIGDDHNVLPAVTIYELDVWPVKAGSTDITAIKNYIAAKWGS